VTHLSKTRDAHRSMLLLESCGYTCTLARGRMGDFDIVAIGSLDFALVKVTRGDWPGAAELESLADFRSPALVRRLLHRWDGRKRMPQVREIK
jgi:hypothetical protein